MPRTRECDFCGADIEPGTGTMLVLNDGSTHHFCSAKCEKNVDLGREARDLEWTESGQRQSGPQTTEPEPEPVEESEDAEAEEAEEIEEAETEDAEEAETEDAETEDAEESDDSDDSEAEESADTDEEGDEE
ncbi:50S ribosomal protein L24e [Halosegnis rubeus]|uniref:Large ribosomal subunit protein eL24 n=1 Tax=Halosegnis rubeus TaxID=2212850 RepID=A0A5N5U5M3_9EURY|nr:50S ribosomal protein L24e [Halosegnis rubeus]KAB7513855.1 50S ribosomal protein L24e [Halosegnis rubeus]